MKKTACTYCVVCLLVAAIYCSSPLSAQVPATWYFEHYNSSHGLPTSEIISLAKDHKGFLWIGTSAGLSCYDGYSFHNYPRTKENELIGFVNVLVPDEKNRLWIGSDAGLFCYVNNEIIKISAASSFSQGVNDILPEKDGTLWLATENGPASIHLNDTAITGLKKWVLSDYILPQWPFKHKNIDDRRILHIRKARDGTVYMAQFSQLFRLSNNKLELIHSISNKRDHIQALFPVSKTTVFYNSIETELHKIENGIHTNIYHDILYKPGVDDNLEGIWFLGAFGLHYFHPETAVASRFISTLAQGVIWPSSLLKDDNIFWVATHDGLIKIKPSLFSLYDVNTLFPAHQDYYSFLQLKNGNLLLGSNRGSVLQKKDTSFHLLYKNVVPASEIKCLYEDERGWLWIGSGYQGLVLIKNNKSIVFTVENGLHDNSFSQFLQTADGRLYAIGDQGVSEIIVGRNGQVSFKSYYYQPTISKHAKFFAGIEAPDGSIWMGGEEGILHLFNDSLHHVPINNQHVSVKDILKDQSGNVWIATDGEGILKCRFNDQHELVLQQQLSQKDGLNTLHYLSLLADQENNIWAGSSLGLTLIALQGKYEGHILNFDESDGFIKPGYYSIKLYQDKGGIIWAGTTFGFVSFKPDEFFLSAAPPAMHMTSVRPIKSNQPISNLFNQNTFSYNNNSFAFSFVAIDYANQKGMRYFYKLEGLDTTWMNAGSLRSVNYENLPPREYTFRVKAVNSKGRVSEQDAVYAFAITAPFWKTGWFIVLFAACCILIGSWLFRRRIAVIKARADIKQQLTGLEIRALRSQMNPHFIFNSLNSISQLVASRQNEEGLQYLHKFSKLLRLVLDESENSFIALKDEIKILDLYLQLESLRFGNSFSYTIHADEEIDEEETLLPSFLIHPVIENAIWHGLLHKEGERRLIITFHQLNKDQLECIVKDNGIGIAAAFQKKQQSLNGEDRQSKGLKIVHDRLALLEQQQKASTYFRMEDMKDDDGYISGTKVTIQLPVVYE